MKLSKGFIHRRGRGGTQRKDIAQLNGTELSATLHLKRVTHCCDGGSARTFFPPLCLSSPLRTSATFAVKSSSIQGFLFSGRRGAPRLPARQSRFR